MAARPDLPRGPRGLWMWAAAVGVAVLASTPLLYVGARAAGAGTDTWSTLLDRRIPVLLVNTLGLTAVTCVATLVLGTGLAFLAVRTDLPGRRALPALCALPLAVPPYVGAVAYADVLGPRGGLRDVLGVEALPSIFGFWGAALVLTVFTYPYVFLLAVAAFRSVNPSYEEAAQALGRGPFAVFAGTTVRLVSPALVGGALLVALYVLSDFGAVSLMRFDTFTTVIYEELGGRFDPPAAAALSSVLVAFTLLFLTLGLAARGRGRFEQTGAGFARRSVTPLGGWRWPALAGVGVVLGLALVLPLARLVTWSVAVLPGDGLAAYAGWTGNSLLVSGLAASACAVLALPVAFVMSGGRARGASRRASRGALAVGTLAQAGYALPGVIVALALVAMSTRYADPLYGTLLLLLVAFVVRFLPQAVQGEEAGLSQIGPSLSEAARGLGASPARAFSRVVLPLLRPSLAVAWAVVFLTAVKELPATLVLRPLGFDTLPVRVWTPASSAIYAEAGPPALLLVIISAVPLYLLLVRRDEAPPIS